jgi:hypothetical protein
MSAHSNLGVAPWTPAFTFALDGRATPTTTASACLERKAASERARMWSLATASTHAGCRDRT